MLKRFVEKDNVFTIFPIGATMQDGGKRKEAVNLSVTTGIQKHSIRARIYL